VQNNFRPRQKNAASAREMPNAPIALSKLKAIQFALRKPAECLQQIRPVVEKFTTITVALSNLALCLTQFK